MYVKKYFATFGIQRFELLSLFYQRVHATCRQNITRKLVNSYMNTMYNNLLNPFYTLYLPLRIQVCPFIKIVLSDGNFLLDRGILKQTDVTARKILNSIIFNTIVYLLYILYYPFVIYEYSLNKSRCTED